MDSGGGVATRATARGVVDRYVLAWAVQSGHLLRPLPRTFLLPEVVDDKSALSKLEFVAREKGSYRVEVYLPQLPKPAGEQPWIISNPIYVR